MTQIDNWFLISAHGIDDTQRTLIHEMVKSRTDEWWHGYPDIWVVQGGQSARDWRNALGVFVPVSPSAILIFQLPDEGRRAWSARAPRSKWEWFKDNYAKPSGLPAVSEE